MKTLDAKKISLSLADSSRNDVLTGRNGHDVISARNGSDKLRFTKGKHWTSFATSCPLLLLHVMAM